MYDSSDLKTAAALAARGSPDIERGEFDGYLLEKPDGTWQAEALGLVVGSGLSLERAETLVEEHGAGRPLWMMPLGREPMLLKAAV